MPELRLEDVLRRPVITEKNTMLSEQNKYTFEVHPDSTKIQIKAAVEDAFKVTVLSVNTLNVKPKPKSRMIRRGAGRIHGSGKAVKKAIVTLRQGDRIDIFEQI
jgi:large subunit ribosomal protein L23